MVSDVSVPLNPVPFYPESLAVLDAELEAEQSAEELTSASVIEVGDTLGNDALDKKSRTEFNKLQKRLRRLVGTAITDYNMIEEGDKVMVCVSGGKDSYTMLEILLNLQISAPVKFDIVAVNMDQKQPGFPEHVLPEYLTKRGVPFYILEKDTYSIVKQLREWDQKYPQRLDSMFTAVQNVAPSQLADRELFDFVSLRATPADATGSASDNGGCRLDVVNLTQ